MSARQPRRLPPCILGGRAPSALGLPPPPPRPRAPTHPHQTLPNILPEEILQLIVHFLLAKRQFAAVLNLAQTCRTLRGSVSAVVVGPHADELRVWLRAHLPSPRKGIYFGPSGLVHHLLLRAWRDAVSIPLFKNEVDPTNFKGCGKKLLLNLQNAELKNVCAVRSRCRQSKVEVVAGTVVVDGMRTRNPQSAASFVLGTQDTRIEAVGIKSAWQVRLSPYADAEMHAYQSLLQRLANAQASNDDIRKLNSRFCSWERLQLPDRTVVTYTHKQKDRVESHMQKIDAICQAKRGHTHLPSINGRLMNPERIVRNALNCNELPYAEALALEWNSKHMKVAPLATTLHKILAQRTSLEFPVAVLIDANVYPPQGWLLEALGLFRTLSDVVLVRMPAEDAGKQVVLGPQYFNIPLLLPTPTDAKVYCVLP